MTKKNNIKKLTPTELKKQVRKLEEQREVFIPVGDAEYSVTYDIHFKKSKIYLLMDDFIQYINEGFKDEKLLDLTTPYIVLLILKHFTSIDVSDDVSEALLLLDTLVDLEILDKILNELPEEEVTKIYEQITVATETFRKNLEGIQEEARETASLIENEELKNELQEMIEDDEEEDTKSTIE